MAADLTPEELKARLKALGLFGLISCWKQIAGKPWLHEVLDIEERGRQKRGSRRKRKQVFGSCCSYRPSQLRATPSSSN